jgi:hypothetical protein
MEKPQILSEKQLSAIERWNQMSSKEREEAISRSYYGVDKILRRFVETGCFNEQNPDQNQNWCSCGKPFCYSCVAYRITCIFEPLIQQAKELEEIFELRHKADIRGITMWRGKHPERELTLPDHADMVAWLLERLDKFEETLKREIAQNLPKALEVEQARQEVAMEMVEEIEKHIWYKTEIGSVLAIEVKVRTILSLLIEEIKKELLTDINGRDTKQAEKDLVAHKLPTLFSYRQAYFVGCQAQLQKVIKRLGEK